MNLDRNSLTTLREMCSREPELFHGYDNLQKDELVKFMEERINGQTIISISDDSDTTDVEIENAQEEELLDVFEDFIAENQESWQEAQRIGNRILRDITNLPIPRTPSPVSPPEIPRFRRYYTPPVPPPTTPPPLFHQIRFPNIPEEEFHKFAQSMRTAILNYIQQEEKSAIEGEYQTKLIFSSMTFEDFFDVAYNRWLKTDMVFHQSLAVINESENPIQRLHALVKERIVEDVSEQIIDRMWDNINAVEHECPVCYDCKPGMIVETQCKHKICLPCLNETWKAKGGNYQWDEKPCPMCREEITEMKFL